MVIIKCINPKSLSECRFNAYIISNGQIKNNQSVNGEINLNLKPGVYKVIIYNQIKVIFYNGEDLIIPFVFPMCIEKKIMLFDKNYQGLKIQRGKIIFNGL